MERFRKLILAYVHEIVFYSHSLEDAAEKFDIDPDVLVGQLGECSPPLTYEQLKNTPLAMPCDVYGEAYYKPMAVARMEPALYSLPDLHSVAQTARSLCEVAGELGVVGPRHLAEDAPPDAVYGKAGSDSTTAAKERPDYWRMYMESTTPLVPVDAETDDDLGDTPAMSRR